LLLKKDAPQDVTSGPMSINVIYKEFPDKAGKPIKLPISAKDKAAPVIVSATCIKSLDPDGKDTLIVVFSEKSDIPNSKDPFKFLTPNNDPYDVFFDGIYGKSDDLKTFTLVVSKDYSGKINGGDSIYINYKAGVKDDSGNEQIVDKNKRVEIKQKLSTKIISATFYDRKKVHDGYVNVIRFDLGIDNLDMSLAREICDAIKLPSARGFEPENIAIVPSGFELTVEEYGAKEAEKGNRDNFLPKTSIDEDDVIVLERSIELGFLTVNASSVKPIDSIAAVIWYAYYNVGEDTTLEVIFSEDVNLSNGNEPYGFWQKSSGDPFEMRFRSAPEKVKGNEWHYKVDYVSIAYPLNGDSIWIKNGGSVYDLSSGNEQKLTTMAPLRLSHPYPMDLTLHIVPQPFSLTKHGKQGYDPRELDPDLSNYYGIPQGSKGVAIILEAKGSISDISAQKGKVRIIDKTGNVVRDLEQMKFDYTPKGSVAGVAIWDGKNHAGRTVGPASYLALVEVEVVFDDRPSKEARIFRKTIMVNIGK
jgi:hypothetical protein